MRALASERGATVKGVREDLDQAAGVNVYRDGFRVLPYGEPRNDWLRLDLRRVQNTDPAPLDNQIVGFCTHLSRPEPELRDQSNREGLIENRAYNDLTEVLRSARLSWRSGATTCAGQPVLPRSRGNLRELLFVFRCGHMSVDVYRTMLSSPSSFPTRG
jgi:hypothetical protein